MRGFFRTNQIKRAPLLQLVEAYRNAEGHPRQREGGASLGNATLPAGDPRRFAKAVEEPINSHNGLLDGALTAEAAAWVGAKRFFTLSLGDFRSFQPTLTRSKRDPLTALLRSPVAGEFPALQVGGGGGF